jgi:hypothetical protein
VSARALIEPAPLEIVAARREEDDDACESGVPE